MAHLFIIAGHGAGDSGAVGYGYTEAERVRALARRIVAYGGSNVTLGDTNRNWYVDKGISSLKISKDWQILELHMDSNVSTAKGGHVLKKDIIRISMTRRLLTSLFPSSLEEQIRL